MAKVVAIVLAVLSFGFEVFVGAAVIDWALERWAKMLKKKDKKGGM